MTFGFSSDDERTGKVERAELHTNGKQVMGIVLGIVLLPRMVRTQENQQQDNAKRAQTTPAQSTADNVARTEDTTETTPVVPSVVDDAIAAADPLNFMG